MRKFLSVALALMALTCLIAMGCSNPSTPEASTTYKVTYQAEGATGSVPVDSNNYHQGDTVTVLGPGDMTRENHAFLYWTLDLDGTSHSYTPGATFTMGQADVTLQANWVFGHSLSFDSNGADNPDSAPVEDMNFAPGAIIVLPDSNGMTKVGYSFIGWNEKADGSGTRLMAGSNYTMPSQDTVLYAMWTDQPIFSVTYNGNGTTENVPQGSSGFLSGDSYTILEPGNMTLAYHQFVEWNTQADGQGTSYSYGSHIEVTSNLELFAIWELATTVLYEALEADVLGVAPVDNAQYFTGDTITIAGQGTLSRPGYTFTGWKQDGDSTLYTAGTTINVLPSTPDAFLFRAQWEALPAINVVYDLNIPQRYTASPSTTTPVDSTDYYEGVSFTAHDGSGIDVPGCVLRGWLDTNGALVRLGSTVSLTQAQSSLTAWWSYPELMTAMGSANTQMQLGRLMDMEGEYAMASSNGSMYIYHQNSYGWTSNQVPNPSTSTTASVSFNYFNDIVIDGYLAAVASKSYPSTRGMVQFYFINQGNHQAVKAGSIIADGIQTGFGAAVATHYGSSGYEAYVSAPGDNTNGPQNGVIKRYHYNGTTKEWDFIENLPSPTWTPGHSTDNNFGMDIVIDGNRMAVRGNYNIFIYEKSGDTWTLKNTINTSNAEIGLGTLDLSGNTLAVSYCQRTDIPSSNSASNISDQISRVDIYQYDYTSWVKQTSLYHPNSTGNSYMRFGSSISLEDDRILIGAMYGDAMSVGSYDGEAFLYRYDNVSDDWIQMRKLIPPGYTLQTRTYFGANVVMDGRYILVSAPGTDNNIDSPRVNDTGAIYKMEM